MDNLRQICSPDEYIGMNSEDLHKHKCHCGTVWKHSGHDCAASSEDFDLGHTCPNCGEYIAWKYFTKEEQEERKSLSSLLTLLDELIDFEKNNFRTYDHEYLDEDFDDC